jgi:DNA-binding MarR family transcriptional regulator
MPDDPTLLALESFLPYRLSLLANRVSRGFARLYQQKFDLKPPEWRVMAVLADNPGLSAGALASLTAMDKVAISRALSRLQRMGRVLVECDGRDRRRQTLALSDGGIDLYRQILPLARQIESTLLTGLDGGARASLNRLLSHLQAAAQHIDPA